MKITIVTPVFPPYRGGIGAVAKAQAECFSLSGHEVAVFTPNYGNAPGDNKDKAGYSLVKIRPLFRYGNAALVPQLLWKARGFDRVILHYPFFGGSKPFLFKKKNNLIVFYHMDVFGRGLLGRFFRFYTKYILPLILSRAKKIIVTSMDYARNGTLKKMVAANPEKFVEIPLGVDTERFKPRPRDSELLAKLDIPPTDKIILFVGGLDSAHYFKGVNILLRAYKKFISVQSYKLPPRSGTPFAGQATLYQNKFGTGQASYKLVIVGSGNLREEYERLAKELGVSDQVIFAGSASEEDLPKYYNLADLFVLPSIDSSESFGLVILEAMASGVPVIASNLPGVRTLVKEGVNGYLVNPGDPEDLSDKISAYFSDLGKAQVMGKEACFATEAYSIKNVREKWNKAIL